MTGGCRSLWEPIEPLTVFNPAPPTLSMDPDTRLRLITGVGEEVITEGELRQLLETNDHPVAYDGF